MIELSSCTIDLGRRVIRTGEDQVGLTPMETKLLHYLAARPGEAVGSDELLRNVWGYVDGVMSRAVDYAVRRLRPKIEAAPSSPQHLKTVYGFGYVLESARVIETQPQPDPTEEAPETPGSTLPLPPDILIERPNPMAEVLQQFAGGVRLITLLGPAGIGKTTLAQMVGRAWTDSTPVHFVDLSETTTRDEVVATVAAAKGTSGAQVVPDAEALWILDNFEQVVECASETVSQWMQAAPSARFLITTRTLLQIPGEFPIEVQPLSQHAAIELFNLRARQVNPSFSSENENLPALVDQLDGLPLAIEFAAGRANVLGVDGLLKRLNDRFALLSTGRRGVRKRQSSLHAALDWSWQLLEPELRSALVQCAIFRGGFTLEAAEAVLDLSAFPGAFVLDAVQGLCHRSLLKTRDRGKGRFDLLSSIREYAAAVSEPIPGCDGLQARHAAYFAKCVGEQEDGEHHHDEVDNLMAAHRWASTHDTGLALRLARIAWEAGMLDAATKDFYVRTLRAAETGAPLSSVEKAIEGMCRATLLYRQGDSGAALASAQGAQVHATEGGDPMLAAGSHEFQSILLLDQNREADALEQFEQALAVLEGLHRPYMESTLRRRYANVLLKFGRHEEAEDALDAADGIHPGDGLRSRMLRSALRLDQGRSAEALIGYRALAAHPDVQRDPVMGYQIAIAMSWALSVEGRLDDAFTLLNETREQWRSTSPVLTLLTCQLAVVEALRGHLEETDDLIAEGRRMLAHTASPGQQHILSVATAARQVEIARRASNPEAPLAEARATLKAIPSSNWLALRIYSRLVRKRIDSCGVGG